MATPVAPDQAQVYTPEGKPLKGEAAEKALSDGTARFLSDDPVYVVSAAGNLEKLPGKHARTAGFRPATNEEIKTHVFKKAGGQATGQAFLEGAADTLTGGYWRDQAAPENEKLLSRAAASESPYARMGGQVGGAAIGAALTAGGGLAGGAAGLATKAGTVASQAASRAAVLAGAAESGLARAALSTGARWAAEGAIYGASDAAAEANLQGTEVTANKVLAGMGEGLLWGGGLGVAGGALGHGLGAAYKGTIGKLARRTEAEMTSGASLADSLNRSSDEFAAKSVVSRNADRFVAAATDGGQSPGRLQRIGAKVKELDVIGPTGAANPKLVAEKLAVATQRAESEVAARVAEAAVPVDMPVVSERVLSFANDIGPKTRALAEDVGFKTQPVKAANDNAATLSDLWAARQKLSERIATMPAAEVQRASNLRNFVDGEIHAATKGTTVENAVRQGLEDAQDYRLVAEHLRAPSEGGGLKSAVNGAVISALWGAATGHPLGAVAGAAVGLGRSAFGHYASEGAAGMMSKVTQRLAALHVTVDGAAKQMVGVAGHTARRAVSVALKGPRDFEQTSRRIVDLTSNPEVAQAHTVKMLGDLHQTHPMLATEIVAGASRTWERLRDEMPKGRVASRDALTPGAPPLAPTAIQKDKWLQKVSVAMNPEGAIRDLANGNIYNSRAQIEALQQYHPDVFESIKERVVYYAAQQGRSLPYAKRIYLSKVFQFSGDWSMKQENQQFIRSTDAPPGDQEQQAPQRPMPNNTGDEYQTTSEGTKL